MPCRYLLFYKPYNVLSQFTDEGTGHTTLKAFIPVKRVYAVGRLDRDSEGLLLLTDDGPMQHRLSHPKFAHGRQYQVQVERVPDENALDRLRKGVSIRGYRTRPAQVRAIAPPSLPPRIPPIRDRKHIPTAWLEMTLTEGKNRQVRRMTAAVGFPTLRLVRTALFLPTPSEQKVRQKFGKRPGKRPEKRVEQKAVTKALTLKGLQPGQWRELTAAEVQILKRSGSAPGSQHITAPTNRRSRTARKSNTQKYR